MVPNRKGPKKFWDEPETQTPEAFRGKSRTYLAQKGDVSRERD